MAPRINAPEPDSTKMSDYLAGDPPVPSSPSAWLRAICADLIRWHGQAVDKQALDEFIAGPLTRAAIDPRLNPEVRIEKAYERQRAAGDAALSKEDRKAAGGEFFNLLGAAIMDCCAESVIATVSGDEARAWHYLMVAQRLRGRLDVAADNLTGPNRPKLAGETTDLATKALMKKTAAREAHALQVVADCIRPTRDETATCVAEMAKKLPRQNRPLTRSYASKMLSKHFPGEGAWPATEAQVRAKIAELMSLTSK